MSKTLNVVAFDMGASNGRAIIGEYDGDVINLKVVHKFPNGGNLVQGSFYWNILGLFNEIKTGLQKAVKETDNNLESVGLDTWGVDYGLLDKGNNLLSNPYHYRDSRTDGLMDEVFAKISRDEIYDQTGIQFMQINTLYQLYAELKNRPWLLKDASDLLFVPDLLNFFLTGQKFNEYTIASTSQLFNPVTEKWAKPIFDKLGIPENIMQELIYPGDVIGQLTEEVKDECGINGELPAIAVGSHDTASAIAATPLTDRDNSVYISSGTWSLLGMELDSPVINSESLKDNFTNECGVKRKIRFLKNISGLWLIQECKRAWEKEGLGLSYDQIDGAAAEAEPAKFKLDPNDERFLNPTNMLEAIRDYCKDTGQYVPENYGEIARGIYESLASNYSSVIDKLEELVDKKIENIHIVGGGIKVKPLCQLTADATGRRVITGPNEATAMGNILTQLMAKGEISSLDEGREIVRKSIKMEEYHPDN